MQHTIKYYILTVITLIMTINASAQDAYRVISDKIYMEQTIQMDETSSVHERVKEFIEKHGGCIRGSYFRSRRHQYADLVTPVLHRTPQNSESRGQIHIDVRVNPKEVFVKLSCDRITVNVNLAGIPSRYNPATTVPLKAIFKKDEIKLDKEDVKKNFNALIKEMGAIKKQLVKNIQEKKDPDIDNKSRTKSNK